MRPWCNMRSSLLRAGVSRASVECATSRGASKQEQQPSTRHPVSIDPTSLQNTPYLEAYNLFEENEDLIFNPEDMLSERAFDGQQVSGAASGLLEPRPASQLPGPRSWPLVGCLPYMLRHPAFDPERVYLFWEAVRREFGPIFRKDMPGHPHLVFITQPEDMEAMMRSTLYDPVRPGMASLARIRSPGGCDGRTHIHDHLFKGKAGILAEQGPEWWRVRRVVQRPATNPALVESYLPHMDAVATEFVARIRRLRNAEDEVPANFKTELYRWALESLGTVALDRRLGSLEEDGSASRPLLLLGLAKQLLGALHETENVKLWQYFPTASIRKLQEAHQVFTDVALEAIVDAEKLMERQRAGCPFSGAEGRLSLLGTLLASPQLSREDVLTFIIDMIATGIDTASHAVGNLLYLLARNPRVQARVRDEVDRVVGDQPALTPAHLTALTYTRAAFRESLRVLPVNVGIVRRLTRDTVLGGYLVPSGWQVVSPTMLMFHEESLFPRAHEFLPERFLRGSPYAPRHNFAFLPFSYGPRMCVGRKIAYQEILCLIVRVMSEFEVDYQHADIQPVNKLSYGPSHPLKFTFRDR